jgi:hypothetical protein
VRGSRDLLATAATKVLVGDTRGTHSADEPQDLLRKFGLTSLHQRLRNAVIPRNHRAPSFNNLCFAGVRLKPSRVHLTLDAAPVIALTKPTGCLLHGRARDSAWLPRVLIVGQRAC